MKKTLTYIIVALSAIILVQCNSQNKKTETMKTTTENTDIKQIIVDVRTIEEWNNDGHADCAVNYPMDIFESKIEELKKYDKVIIVCRSGNRAGIAKDQLRKAGYTKEIENLGSWKNITCNTK